MTEQAATETTEAPQDPVLGAVLERFGDRILESTVDRDQPTFVIERDNLLAVAAFLRDTAGLEFVRLVDLCGADFLDVEPRLNRRARFEVVYHLHSFILKRWARIRVPVDEDDPVVPSLTGLWPGANWYEREAFDLFGFQFTDHPDLTRILMPDDWEGNPLRKDFQPPREPHEWSFNPEEWQKAVQRGG
ncbi:MAG: NADH-quinone oxidoreductase subunit C [Chloroflexota bacterium]